MSKSFVLAIVRANGTRWNVSMSNAREQETFVGKGGALTYCKRVAQYTPVEALVYKPGADRIEEAWFYDKGSERKLGMLTLPEDQEKPGNW